MVLFPSSCSHFPFSSLFNVDFNGFPASIRLSIFFFFFSFFLFRPRWGGGARADIGARGLLLIFLTGKRETTILSVNEQPRRGISDLRDTVRYCYRGFYCWVFLVVSGKVDNFFGRRWRCLPG